MTHIESHGGDLRHAVAQFGGDLASWLDLSTGISPFDYPCGDLPQSCFNRLPVDDHALREAAARFYSGSAPLLAAGSQALIQLLPQLREAGTVGLPDVGYREHEIAWRRQGHTVCYYDATSPLGPEELLDRVDVLVVINPCNPTGQHYRRADLLEWHQHLLSRGGLLVVDEAFAELMDQSAVADAEQLSGLVVLRSLGKFFGLPGLRLGCGFMESVLRERVSAQLGPWGVSGPALYVAERALSDRAWQQQARDDLARVRQQIQPSLQRLAEHIGVTLADGGLFFSLGLTPATADELQQRFAQQQIWTRVYAAEPLSWWRIGLFETASEDLWQRFDAAINAVLQA